MRAFKLFRLKKNGDITSLFINKRRVLSMGEWMIADNYPTKGFAERMGWHSLKKKSAPHLSKKNRIWGEVEIQDYREFQRPRNQGGRWFLSNKMKINKILL